jgi:hypothetical protein
MIAIADHFCLVLVLPDIVNHFFYPPPLLYVHYRLSVLFEPLRLLLALVLVTQQMLYST